MTTNSRHYDQDWFFIRIGYLDNYEETWNVVVQGAGVTIHGGRVTIGHWFTLNGKGYIKFNVGWGDWFDMIVPSLPMRKGVIDDFIAILALIVERLYYKVRKLYGYGPA